MMNTTVIATKKYSHITSNKNNLEEVPIIDVVINVVVPSIQIEKDVGTESVVGFFFKAQSSACM